MINQTAAMAVSFLLIWQVVFPNAGGGAISDASRFATAVFGGMLAPFAKGLVQRLGEARVQRLH